MGLLCQLPQSTHNKPPHRAWLARLGNALGHLHLAVEFRHRSWATPELVSWLQEHQLELVSVDAPPPIATLFPSGLLAATPRLYVRLHSRRGAAWYAGEKERYDYNYTDAELAEWIRALSEAGESQTALLLFNNCYRSQAARNASRLQALLAAREGPFEVVSAFAERPPVQRSLF